MKIDPLRGAAVAEYQFQFGFAPSTALPQRLPAFYPSIRDLPAFTARLWHRVDLPGSLLESLDRLLPEFRRVSATQMYWGDYAGSCVEVSTEDGLLTNCIVNVDVRVPHLALVAELSLIAKRQNWLVITQGCEVFRPSLRRFLSEIQLSPAMRRFRCDPEFRARNAASSGLSGSLPPQRSLPPG